MGAEARAAETEVVGTEVAGWGGVRAVGVSTEGRGVVEGREAEAAVAGARGVGEAEIEEEAKVAAVEAMAEARAAAGLAAATEAAEPRAVGAVPVATPPGGLEVPQAVVPMEGTVLPVGCEVAVVKEGEAKAQAAVARAVAETGVSTARARAGKPAAVVAMAAEVAQAGGASVVVAG